MSSEYVPCLNPKLCGVQKHRLGTQAACQIKGVKNQVDFEAHKLLSQLSSSSAPPSIPEPSNNVRKIPDRAAPKFFSSSTSDNRRFDFDKARNEIDYESSPDRIAEIYTRLIDDRDMNGNEMTVPENKVMGRVGKVGESVSRSLQRIYNEVERQGYRDNSNNVVLQDHDKMTLPQKALTSLVIRQMDGSVLGGESKIEPGETDHEIKFSYEENGLRMSSRLPLYSQTDHVYKVENLDEPFEGDQNFSGINDFVSTSGQYHAKVLEDLSNMSHLVNAVRDMDVFSRHTGIALHNDKTQRRAGIKLFNNILDSETQNIVGKRVNSKSFALKLESSEDGSEIIVLSGSKIVDEDLRDETISATLAAFGREDTEDERERLCDQLYLIDEVSRDVSVKGSL